jgi:hypothetical protein
MAKKVNERDKMTGERETRQFGLVGSGMEWFVAHLKMDQGVTGANTESLGHGYYVPQ